MQKEDQGWDCEDINLHQSCLSLVGDMIEKGGNEKPIR